MSVTPENIIKHKVDGEVLNNLGSANELVTKYSIPSEDANIIFESIESLRKYNNKSKDRNTSQVGYFGKEGDTSIIFSVVNFYKDISPDFYETLEETLRTAGFKNTKPIMKYSFKMAKFLMKQGKLKKLNMTKADAMALAIYTYDNGIDVFDDSPYRIISEAFTDKNAIQINKFKGYILRLLSALRKLPSYSESGKLYKAVTNINVSNYKVGSTRSWPAFVSTFSDEKSIVDFFDAIAVEGNKCIFEVTGCFNKGHNIKNFSFRPDEDGK